MKGNIYAANNAKRFFSYRVDDRYRHSWTFGGNGRSKPCG
jgi:hypothetical protein